MEMERGVEGAEPQSRGAETITFFFFKQNLAVCFLFKTKKQKKSPQISIGSPVLIEDRVSPAVCYHSPVVFHITVLQTE